MKVLSASVHGGGRRKGSRNERKAYVAGRRGAGCAHSSGSRQRSGEGARLQASGAGAHDDGLRRGPGERDFAEDDAAVGVGQRAVAHDVGDGGVSGLRAGRFRGDKGGLTRADVAQFEGNLLDGASRKEIEGRGGISQGILVLGLQEGRTGYAASRGVDLGDPGGESRRRGLVGRPPPPGGLRRPWSPGRCRTT